MSSRAMALVLVVRGGAVVRALTCRCNTRPIGCTCIHILLHGAFSVCMARPPLRGVQEVSRPAVYGLRSQLSVVVLSWCRIIKP